MEEVKLVSANSTIIIKVMTSKDLLQSIARVYTGEKSIKLKMNVSPPSTVHVCLHVHVCKIAKLTCSLVSVQFFPPFHQLKEPLLGLPRFFHHQRVVADSLRYRGEEHMYLLQDPNDTPTSEKKKKISNTHDTVIHWLSNDGGMYCTSASYTILC